MKDDLAIVLADFREQAAILRANGHGGQAATMERVVDAVATSAADYLAWISEPEAMMRANRGADFFRSRRDAWAEDGLAERRGRRWFYRRIIVPRSKLSSLITNEAARERSA